MATSQPHARAPGACVLLVVAFSCYETPDDPRLDAATTELAPEGASSGAMEVPDTSAGPGSTADPRSSSGSADDAVGPQPEAEGESDASSTGDASSTSSTDEGSSSTSTGSPPSNCGNGSIDAGEQCDGTDLQGFDCVSIGLAGGNISCDPVTCTLDTSQCEGAGGTSG